MDEQLPGIKVDFWWWTEEEEQKDFNQEGAKRIKETKRITNVQNDPSRVFFQ